MSDTVSQQKKKKRTKKKQEKEKDKRKKKKGSDAFIMDQPVVAADGHIATSARLLSSGFRSARGYSPLAFAQRAIADGKSAIALYRKAASNGAPATPRYRLAVALRTLESPFRFGIKLKKLLSCFY